MMKETRYQLLLVLSFLLTMLFATVSQDLRAQGSAQVQILGVPGVLDSPSLAEQINRFETGQYPIQFVYTAPTNREETFRFLFTLERDGRRLAEVESEPVTFSPGFYLYNNFRDDPQIGFRETLSQIIRSLPRAERSSFNSGLFPEGNYTLTIEAVPDDRFSMISTLPGFTQFTVSYGQPPQLVSPAEESFVIQPFPVFTWSPVIAPADVNVEYEIRIVELLSGQQPEQAIDGARFPIVEEVVQNLTSFMMTPQQLQLEPGTVYAWQVTARDAFGEYPFRNGGRSEIGIFNYSGLPGDGESLADLQEIILVPGFASLTNLIIEQSEEDEFSYTLDGFATLHIGNPTTVPIQFSQLRIQKTGLDNPVVLGGNVNGGVQEAELPFGQASSVVEFLDISWTFGEAFQLSGDIRLPGTGAVASSGSISWTPQGLQGELTADAPDGLKIGKNPVEAELASVTARFPEAMISASGSLSLFGESAGCQIGTISIGQDGAGLAFDCDLDKEIPLSEGHDLVALKGKRAVGNLSSNANGETAFNMSLSADLNLNLFTGPDCSSSMQLGINNEDGVIVQSFSSSCLTNPSLNLGIGTLHIRNLETPEISYSEDDGWGYRIPANQDLAFQFERRQSDMSDPSQPGQQPGQDPDDEEHVDDPVSPGDDAAQTGDDPTPPGDDDPSDPVQPGDQPGQQPGDSFEDDDVDETTPPEPGREPIRTPTDDGPQDPEESDAISDEGLEFREREYDENQLRNSEGCISGFFVQPKRFHMPEFVLPWADYLPASSTVDFPLEFFFDAELRLGCTTVKPRVQIPECLQDVGIRLAEAEFSNGQLSAMVETTDLPAEGCFTSFGPGFVGGEDYGLKLKQIKGSFGGSVGAQGFNQTENIEIETALMAGAPFACGENQSSTELLTGDLSIRGDGIFEGELSGNTECPLELGGFSLSLTDATVAFRAGQLGQRARLTATAELEYDSGDGQNLTSKGHIAINLVTGEIEDLYLEIEGPYIWRLPEENPFMEFELEQIVLNREGFYVDAQQSLLVGDDSIDVLFNEVQVGFDGRIESGEVVIMEELAIRGDLDGNNPDAGGGLPVSFSLSDADTTLPETLSTGFLARLGSGIVLDRDGLFLSGSASAGLRFAGFDLPELNVEFGDDSLPVEDAGMRLAFNSPVITTGQMNLFLNNSRVAWVESGGFFADPQWYEVLIPETLYLPTADIASVTLRSDDGELLVDYTIQEDRIALSTIEGETLNFEAPILAGLGGPTPAWQVTLNEVELERGSHTLLQGEIIASIPEGFDPVDLTPLGLPIAMRHLSFGFRDVDGEQVRKLFVDGQITLFDHLFEQSPDVMFYVNADGNFGGSLTLTGLNERIELVSGLDFVQLVINELNIEMNESPNAGANLMNRLNLNFDGGIGFFDGDNAVAYAQIGAEWLNNGRFHISSAIEMDDTVPTHIELGPVFAGVEEVNHLSLNYQPGTGFTFELGMDMYMGFTLDDETFTIPIPDINLNQERLHIAELDLHPTNPGLPLNIPEIDVFGVRLQTDFISIDEFEIDWSEWDPLALLDIKPEFDFTLRLPAFEDTNTPSLSVLGQTEFFIQGATIADGFLNGDISARTFNGGLPIPIGPVQAVLEQASGVFYVDNNVQQFDFMFSAQVYDLPGFDSNGENCDPSEIALQLVGGSEFAGEVQINPCGRRELGPLALEMGTSTLIFSTSQENQTAILDGSATLILPPLPGVGIESSPTAEGSLEIDLLNFEILGGSIDVDVPFRYSLPSLENPFLDLQVNQAWLDPDGFTISGESNLLLGETASLDVALDSLQFSFETFAITGGSLSIDSALQINVGLTGGSHSWNISVPDVGNVDIDTPDEAHFSAVFNGGLTLDMNGISLSGDAVGWLNIAGMNVDAEGGQSFFGDLNIQVVEDEEGQPFRLALNEPGALLPVSMESGRINLMEGQTVLAYYENNQLEFMGINILASLLPNRIPLPSESIAYLDLENSDISEEMVDGNRRLAASGVSLVIDAFGVSNQITATVDNLDVALNNDYSAITAVHSFDVSFDAPGLLEKTGFPLTLTGLDYSSTESGFQLSMSARLDLPESMMNHFGLSADQLEIEEITLTEGGFQQGSFALGTYVYDTETEPLISESISEGVGGEFAIYGIELAIGGENALRFSGYFDLDYMASGDDRNPLYYNAIWEGEDGNYLWDLTMNLEDQQEINLGLASLGVEAFGGSITMSTQNGSGELHTWITGAIGFSDLLGSEFSLHAEKLGLTVNNEHGISVGAESISYTGGSETEKPDFSLFNEQMTGNITGASLVFDNDVIGISIAGNLTILDTEVVFDTLRINTNLDFEIDVSLADSIYIVEDYAWIDTIELFKGEDEEGYDVLRFTGGVGLNLPDGIADGSGVDEISGSLSLTQKNNGQVVSELGVYVGFETLADMEDNQSTDAFNFIELGDFFLFEVRGLGVNVDLLSPLDSEFYGYAGLYFEQDGGSWKTDKVVHFGDFNNPDLPGFSYNAGDQSFTWHVEATGIEVDLGVFKMTLANIKTVPRDDLPEHAQHWPLVLDASGSFEFNIPNVEGSNNSGGTGAGIGFDNFVVGVPPGLDENPIIQWPTLTGVEISIMGIVNVSLGTYEYVVGGVVEMAVDEIPENPDDVPDNPEPMVEEIAVNYFLHFKGADDESSALQVSFTGLFSGGVDQIKIYETTEGDRRVFIDNANLSIEGADGLVSMNLTLNYESSDDRFYIMAAGSASIGPNGFMLAGEFEKDGNDFRMGLFIAGRFNPGIPLIPQAPPVINLTGIGGGIFYRPTSDVIEAIYSSPFLGVDVSNLNDWGMPDISDNIKFAVLAYGSFSMLGQAGVYAMEGNILFALTNEFIQLNASGVLLMQEGNISADLGTGVKWSSSEIVIGGEIYAGITYPVLEGSGNIGYTVEVAFGPPVTVDWALWGNYQAWIVGLESSGQFFISPAGLFASMNVTADLNLGLAALEGSLDAKVWAVPDINNPNLGAFASASISASAFGFDFVSLQLQLAYEQTANSTYLKGFALAALQAGDFASIEGFILVEMLYVLGEMPNIKVEVAYSLSPELQALVDDASGQASDMESAMSDAVNFLFQLPDFDVNMSEEELVAAGQAVQNVNQLRNQHSGLATIGLLPLAAVINIEEQIYEGQQLPAAFQWVNANILVNPDFPDDSYKTQAKADLENALSSLNDHKDEVHQRYQEVQVYAIESLETLSEAIEPMADPTGEGEDQLLYEDGLVVNVKSNFTISREETMQFIDESMAGLSGLEPEELQQRDLELRTAISAAIANLQFLDQAIEEDLLDHGNRYASAHSNMLKYIGEEVSEYRQYLQKYSELYDALVNQENQIMEAIEFSWDRIATMHPNQCRNIVGGGGTISFIDCITVAGEIAIARTQQMQGFAGIGYENAAEGLQTALTTYRNTLFAFVNDGVFPFTAMVNQNYSINSVINNGQNLINTLPSQANTSTYEAALDTTLEIIETIKEGFETTAENFWYGIHYAAFSELRNAYNSAAGDFNEAAAGEIDSFKDNHLGYTDKMAELFSLKTQLSETLYSLIDAYRIFYQEHQDDIVNFQKKDDADEEEERERTDSFAQFLQAGFDRDGDSGRTGTSRGVESPPLYTTSEILSFKDELQNWLQPPAISSLTGNFNRLSELTPSNTFRDRFISRNTLSWNFSGPWQNVMDGVGNVELGISASPNPAPLAISKANSFVHYSWLRAGDMEVAQNEFTNAYHVNLRARSRAGIPVSVQGNFSSTVASAGDSFAGFSHMALVPAWPGSGQQVMQTAVPNLYGIKVLSGVQTTGNWQTWYTHNSDELRLELAASGASVNRFEVRLLAQNGLTIMDWQTVPGVRDYAGSNTILTGTLNEPEFAENETHYILQARAVAADGSATSSIQSRTLILDTTPPQWYDDEIDNNSGYPWVDNPAQPPSSFMSGTVVQGVMPARSPSVVHVEEVDLSDYRRDIKIADPFDSVSGIKNIEVVLNQNSEGSQGMFANRDKVDVVQTTTFENVQLPSFGTWYVHARAQNNAGLFSDVKTYEIRHPDPTPPAAPQVAVQPRNNGLRVFLPQLANDPESGIVGYQFSYRSEDGSAVRAWPEGTGHTPAIDFTNDDLVSLGNSAPYFRIPMQAANSELDLVVRAVSGNGTFSQSVVVPGVKFDLRQPKLKSIETNSYYSVVNGKNQKLLDVNALSVNGFSSGIRYVKITISEAKGSSVLERRVSYTDNLPNLTTVTDAQFSGIPIDDLLDSGTLNITIEVESGAGVRSTFEEQIVITKGDGFASAEK